MIICILCKHLGLAHDGDHIVPRTPPEQEVEEILDLLSPVGSF